MRSAVLLTLAVVSALPAGAPMAGADDGPPSGYPTWADVQAAKSNADSAKAEADRIGSLLTSVESTAADASAKAVTAGAASAKAAQAVKDQQQVVAVLDAEAAKRAAERDAAQRQAGQLAADSYMGGSGGGPIEALSVIGQQDGLNRLQTLQVLGDQTAQAVRDYRVAANAAAAAEDASQAAKDALADLAATAAQQFSLAQQAQQQAQDVVTQTQQHEDLLLAQLADLKGTSVEVEQKYREGQAAQAAYAAAQEAKRRAAEQAAQQAAAEAQRRQQEALARQQEALAQQQAQQQQVQTQRQVPVQPPAPVQGPAASGQAQGAAVIPAAPVVAPLPAAPPPPPPAVSPGVGVVDDPAGAQAYASSQLGAYGWDSGQFGCLLKLWTQESSWLTDATNPSSGAYGIAQALPPSKYYTAGSDWLTNYRTQINWGLGYIASRYGTPCNAWAHEVSAGWY
ncbi:lytic transglycosylase domain-containing protein [Sinomonas sp. JC656]|uniref:Lytic transglycosylase domain-containing protein n=2 Tax=Sinomonas cellulolyticus TaxID=2801916 RepID=A0ABS1K5E4_9MICC|nr:lytic transglycosylase domain-containing protein [Sinomonas sp. KCTC 49339]MBL0706735.1 lytic transglycosylase domain-containing protein [Sinomonas cellulolyticus]